MELKRGWLGAMAECRGCRSLGGLAEMEDGGRSRLMVVNDAVICMERSTSEARSRSVARR